MRLAPFAAALVLLSLGGCDFGDNVSSIEVSLSHESAVATHLLTDSEDFSPSNRVEPGMGRTRRVPYRLDEANPEATFRGGRNGVVIATVTCPIFGSTGQFVVVFNANETMSCP